MKNEILNFSDWFDPYNIEHIKAYKYLHTKGQWPKNFIPENCVINNYWESFVKTKIIDAWIEYKLEGKL